MLVRPALRAAQQRCALPAAALCPPPRHGRPCPQPSAPPAVRSGSPSDCSCRRLSTSVALDVARPSLDGARLSVATEALRPASSCAVAAGPIRCAAPFHSSAAISAPLKFRKDPLLYYRKVGILPDVHGPTTTWSFYRYTPLQADKLEALRQEILLMFLHLSVRGRVHLAPDGISAHLCCPDRNLPRVTKHLGLKLPNIPPSVLRCYEGQSDDGPKLTTLHVRVKKQILNDGLDEVATWEDTTPQPKRASPAEWHAMVTDEIERAKQEGTEKPVIIDLRNQYETEVGRVDGAMLFEANTFRDLLPLLRDFFAKRCKQDKRPIFFYCTGGIRCTRAGSILAQEGWDNIVMMDGGITAYGHFLKGNTRVVSLFKGKNFTFDTLQRITDDVLGRCQTCPLNGYDGKSEPAAVDIYSNCANRYCHLLFIQCDRCRQRTFGTCGRKECMEAVKGLAPETHSAAG